MSGNPPKRGQKRKRSVKRKPQSPIPEMFSRVRRQIDERWPNLGRQLASLIRISREKVDDVYSSAAEAINEHKEAYEDRRAERKAKARAAARAERPTETKTLPPRGEQKKKGPAVNRSGSSSPGKKATRRSPKSNS